MSNERVIKFRAFADFGKFSIMLYDVSIHATSNMIGVDHEHLVETLESTDWRVTDDYEFENKKTGDKFSHDSVKVYDTGEDYYFFEDTKVMQLTGLRDKNGVEIYEADVVVHNGENCVINFKAGSFGIDFKETARKPYDRILSSTQWEVIGNKYTNPELLSP